MKEEELKKYLNKNVRIFLKNNFNYFARIIKINSDSILILDKFSNEVLIDSNEISVITLGGMGENGARDS